MRHSFWVLGAMVLLTGCNTMAQKTYQKITVYTPHVKNADCSLETVENKYSVISPGEVLIERSKYPITVTCEKANYVSGSAYLEPVFKMEHSEKNFWNGYYPGVAYDVASNSIFDYPASVTVMMESKNIVPEQSPQPYIIQRKLTLTTPPLAVDDADTADMSFSKSLRK
jgi:hypothetical protein